MCIRDRVDFGILPFKRRHGATYTGLAADFFWIKIAHGIAVAYFAATVGCAGQIQHGFCQRCFAGPTVAGNGQVDDVICLKLFHNLNELPFPFGMQTHTETLSKKPLRLLFCKMSNFLQLHPANMP